MLLVWNYLFYSICYILSIELVVCDKESNKRVLFYDREFEGFFVDFDFYVSSVFV